MAHHLFDLANGGIHLCYGGVRRTDSDEALFGAFDIPQSGGAILAGCDDSLIVS